jgi:hypothetical protein
MERMNTREITYSSVEDCPMADPTCPLALEILAKPRTDFGPSEVEASKGKGGIVGRIHYVAELSERLCPLVLQVRLCFALEGFEDMEMAPIMLRGCFGGGKNIGNGIGNG